MRLSTGSLLWGMCLLTCCAVIAQPTVAAMQLTYGAAFAARFVPGKGVVEAKISIDQRNGELRVLDLAAPEERYAGFSGNGEVQRDGARVLWRVPRRGGTLKYRLVVDHHRGDAYDARMTEHWAIVRLDDLFPPARVRSRVGARSESSVVLTGPRGWSFETRYGSAARVKSVDDLERRFDRPTGWAAAGELGIRRDTIADRKVAVAAPDGEQFRRVDTLAFLRWTLPALATVFPDFPPRLLIVGAGDGMWRGGLSGPGSLFLHADRPLISENGTSALLHELVHIATSAPGTRKDDWVVEGLAEYYSLEILRRSGGISERRFTAAMESLQAWVKRDAGGRAEPSTGADTAWAVLQLRALADELRDAGESLDEVVGFLLERRTLTGSALRSHTEQRLGRASVVLAAIGG